MKTPRTAAEVTFLASTREEFERELRAWLEGMREVGSRPELRRRVTDSPPLLRSRLVDRGHCDAFLAAWVEWVCLGAGLKPPQWVEQPNRVKDFLPEDARDLDPAVVAATPGAFRRRNLFLVPEPVVRLRRGRPRKGAEEKRAGNAERQRRFRERVKAKLRRLEELERRSATLG